MNIAVYSHYFPPEIGAPSARINDMAQKWIKHGNSVQGVTCLPNHPGGRLYPGYEKKRYMYERIDGIEVHRHWTYITPNEGIIKKTIGHISYYPGAMYISNRFLKPPDVTLGTSPTFFAASAAARTAKKYNVPFIMDVRDLWPAIFVDLGIIKNKNLIRLLEYWEMSLYRRAAKIVTVTEAFRQNLLERGIDENKVITIRNGADLDYWVPSNNSEKIKSELGVNRKFIVLYIGAHGISHALAKIIESAEMLKNQEQIQFLFVGDGAEKRKIVQLAEEKRLNNVIFLDPVEKSRVRYFYSMADICLVPLRNVPLFETFIPSKMFEIMAMERPIVASVRGESAEILKNSKGAIIVEPEDSKKIADAIISLYNNQGQRLKMGKEGRLFVEKFYSREYLANKYLDVLQNAISTRNRVKR